MLLREEVGICTESHLSHLICCALSSSSMLSITTLTSTRASKKPETNRTGWQYWPFSMMYVSHEHCPSPSSKCQRPSDRQIVSTSTQNASTISDTWPSVLLLGTSENAESAALLRIQLHVDMLNECLLSEERSGCPAGSSCHSCTDTVTGIGWDWAQS